jgi:hypothetical protein
MQTIDKLNKDMERQEKNHQQVIKRIESEKDTYLSVGVYILERYGCNDH